MSTLTNTFTGTNAINCSAVIVAHGRFPEDSGFLYAANLAFRVPQGVKVFFYATPGEILWDANWISAGRYQFLPENTLASSICRSVFENANYSPLWYEPGQLAPDLDIITDGFAEKDPNRDRFVSGIKTCFRPFTIPFHLLNLRNSGRQLLGRTVYKLSTIIQFCIDNRHELFPMCDNRSDIHIHVSTCMENCPNQDSVRLYARRVLLDQTQNPTDGQVESLVKDLKSRSTGLLDQKNQDIRDKQTYSLVRNAQEYDRHIEDYYGTFIDIPSVSDSGAQTYYESRLQQDMPQNPLGTPPQTTQQGRGAGIGAGRGAGSPMNRSPADDSERPNMIVLVDDGLEVRRNLSSTFDEVAEENKEEVAEDFDFSL
jgi:hypothetical protein